MRRMGSRLRIRMTNESFAYLAAVNHMYARCVVGWSMQSRQTTDLFLQASLIAIQRKKPNNKVLIHAVAESFFNLPNRERIRRRTYKTRDHARQKVFDFIKMFYNPQRKYVKNGMASPVESEMRQELTPQSV
jgi:putative transposase